MRNLVDLLKRFSSSLNKDTETKETITRVILERTGVRLSPEHVSLKNGVLEITAHPAANNQLSLKEKDFLEELKGAHKIPVSRVLYK